MVPGSQNFAQQIAVVADNPVDEVNIHAAS